MGHGGEKVVLVDRTGRVIDATPSARALFGAKAIGQRCSEVVGVRRPDGTTPCTGLCTPMLVSARDARVTLGEIDGKPRRVTCTAMAEHTVVRIETPEPQAENVPSPRERDVLGCVAEGMTTRQAAAELGMQYATARTHLENVRARLGVKTTAEAVRKALRQGWIGRTR